MIKLNYVEKGEGDVLILLHGNGESHEYFVNQIDFFGNKFRVIAVDTRGHGGSPRGCAPFTLAQFAEDLKCFADEMNIKKANILGFSDGGNIALLFALKYPYMVDRLILNGANLYPDGIEPDVKAWIEEEYRAAIENGDKKKEELFSLMVNEPNISEKELASLNVRTLVIAGTRDMIRAEHTRLIARSLPDSELVFIEGDHFTANKNSGEFNEAVDRFLRY